MNKKMFTYALVAVGVIALVGTGVVWASEKPQRINSNVENFSCQEECSFDYNSSCNCMKNTNQNKFSSIRGGFSGGDLEVKAAALGIDLETLEAELASGKTFHELVQSLGIDQSQMQERVKENLRVKMSDRLDSAVEAGLISQEEAVYKLNNLGEKQGMKRNMNFRSGQGCGCQK